MFDESEVYGDGVNIAVRLEALADPGGICISQTVYDHVKNRVDAAFEAIGSRQLKSIEQPVFLYTVDWTSSNVSRPARQTFSNIRKRQVVIGIIAVFLMFGAGIAYQLTHTYIPSNSYAVAKCKPSSTPSIAVLPFSNVGNEAQHENLVDGITNDIITDLAQVSDLFVVAANSTFRYKGLAVNPQDVARELCVRYIVEGSIQRISNELRVNAQLIEANTGRHLWAERYDRKATDIFAVQNEISWRIVQIVGPISDAHGRLMDVELDRLARTPTQNLEAYDHFLKGIINFEKGGQTNNNLARKEFKRAIELDPQYAKAMAKLTWTYLREYVLGWAQNPRASLKLAEDVAAKAVDLAPGDASTHHALGSVNLFLRKHDIAIRSYKKSVELNPNGADLRMHLGWALTWVGLPDEGLQQMNEAISRDPYFPDWYLGNLAWAHFVARRYQRAIEPLERRVSRSTYHHLMSAAIYYMAGRKEAASEAIGKFRKALPNYTLETVADRYPFENREDLEHFLTALRGAGLPEHAITSTR
jgi:TolB-like protein/Flp pilus assembly protein TadD